jgi:hypothetical protein
MVTVFYYGMGFLGFPIDRRAANDTKGTQDIFKTLNGLGKAAEGEWHQMTSHFRLGGTGKMGRSVLCLKNRACQPSEDLTL